MKNKIIHLLENTSIVFEISIKSLPARTESTTAVTNSLKRSSRAGKIVS